MLKVFLIVALSILSVYLIVLLIVFLTQRSFQYFPSHVDSEGEGNDVFSPWRDGGNRFVGYFRPSEEPKSAMMVFHGNGGEALDRAWVNELAPTSTLIFLFEYPGYGAREGQLSEKSFFEAAEKAFDEIKAKWDVPIIVLGESLGSGVACYLASRKPVSRLALITPFSSAIDVAAYHYPFFPVRLLMKDPFESVKFAKSLEIPLHIIHGTMDQIVPIKLSKKLFESYIGKEKTFSEIPGFGHNDLVAAILNSPLADSFLKFIRQ